MSGEAALLTPEFGCTGILVFANDGEFEVDRDFGIDVSDACFFGAGPWVDIVGPSTDSSVRFRDAG